ncbi:MAG: RelE toxin of RelE / RelB toxin-antitoxin system [uncultured Sulfurovum sp.]|uniref:RelE toxin of RelE / RelB toxin-antitoxin system n=1 Tax=uncultured Sulfurovum sp. TaxID=269237 RepID=A0A6S6S1I2_9BACT|nr:MAG: RelE toxin of RelE / RelB toxin-antitoxin system [uncultured Sulfurovum sp.]
MRYEVKVVDTFKRDTKKLFKKYKSIKSDILELVEKLELDYKIGIHLGNNLYKIRVKNSDIGGKSGGYRVIYYTKLPSNSIYLLSIYAKTQKENIDIEILKPIIDKLNKIK